MEIKTLKQKITSPELKRKIKFFTCYDVSELFEVRNEKDKVVYGSVIFIGLNEQALPIFQTADTFHEFTIDNIYNRNFTRTLLQNFYDYDMEEELEIIRKGGEIIETNKETYNYLMDGKQYKQYRNSYFGPRRILMKGDVIANTKHFICRYGSDDFYSIFIKTNKGEKLITSGNCRHAAISKTKLLEKAFYLGENNTLINLVKNETFEEQQKFWRETTKYNENIEIENEMKER